MKTCLTLIRRHRHWRRGISFDWQGLLIGLATQKSPTAASLSSHLLVSDSPQNRCRSVGRFQSRVAGKLARTTGTVCLWFRFLFTGEAGGRPGAGRDAGRHLADHRLSAWSQRFSSGWPMSRPLWRSGGAPKPSQCLLEKPRAASRPRRVSQLPPNGRFWRQSWDPEPFSPLVSPEFSN